MSSHCERPVENETLFDYFSGELGEHGEDEVETHLFACESCSEKAERVSGLLAAVANGVPPVLSPARFAELERRGRVQAVNVMRAGETAEANYPETGRLLVHRLVGFDLSESSRIDLGFSDITGRKMGSFEDVPFDRERGEIVLACQRHFADIYPRDVVFTVVSVTGERQHVLGQCTVEHRLA